jgi:hypothetical protein
LCTAEEEANKTAIDDVNATGVTSTKGPLDYHKDLEDLSLIFIKEREKFLARKMKDVDKAILKKQMEGDKEKEKSKSAEKTSKVARKLVNTLEVISYASPFSQSHKRDATLVGLSFSTLQYGTSPLTRVSTGVSIAGNEFFF